MYNLEEIIEFIKGRAAVEEVNPYDDIFEEHGLSGDDCDEFLSDYSKRFNVNMSGFLWYFHHGEEGNSFGGMAVAPPNERVKRIPLTPIMLLDFANKGYWDIKYPPHSVPKFRWDTAINLILLLTFLVLAIRSCVK